MGNPRVSTFLYSSSTAMNSLTRLGHQIDSELGAIALGTKETQKAINSLKDMNVKIHRTVLISDSQTCLCLCSRPSSTLDLLTSLIVSRVQDLWDPHLENLYFAPGKTFHNNVDLLTLYQPHLKSLLRKEFYRPSFLLPEIQDRVTIRVTNMSKQSQDALPHNCAQQQVWALMKGSRLGPNRLSKPQASTQTFRSGKRFNLPSTLNSQTRYTPYSKGQPRVQIHDSSPPSSHCSGTSGGPNASRRGLRIFTCNSLGESFQIFLLLWRISKSAF